MLVRAVGQDGADLVISREYVSRSFRVRAEELVGLELGPAQWTLKPGIEPPFRWRGIALISWTP